MARQRRDSPAEETDIWWRDKLEQWRRAGRLRKDGTLKVDVSMPYARPDLTPEEIRAILFALPPKKAIDQRRELVRMRGRKSKTWRRRFDKSGPTEDGV